MTEKSAQRVHSFANACVFVDSGPMCGPKIEKWSFIHDSMSMDFFCACEDLPSELKLKSLASLTLKEGQDEVNKPKFTSLVTVIQQPLMHQLLGTRVIPAMMMMHISSPTFRSVSVVSTGITAVERVFGWSFKDVLTDWRLCVFVMHEQKVIGWQACTWVWSSGVLEWRQRNFLCD